MTGSNIWNSTIHRIKVTWQNCNLLNQRLEKMCIYIGLFLKNTTSTLWPMSTSSKHSLLAKVSNTSIPKNKITRVHKET
jgi:hypothetical protein